MTGRDATVYMSTLKTRLSRSRVNELKDVLGLMRLSKSGRKSELIDRIYDAMSSYLLFIEDGNSNPTTRQFYENAYSNGVSAVTRYIDSSNGNAVTNVTARYLPVQSNMQQNLSIPNASLSVNRTSYRIPVNMNGSNGCFCYSHLNSSFSVRCIECHVEHNSSSHEVSQNKRYQWKCELCRTKEYDPFIEVIETIYGSQRIQGNQKQTLSFPLYDQHLNSISRDINNDTNQHRLYLFCVDLLGEMHIGHSWPERTAVRVNYRSVRFVQRAPPAHQHPSKIIRELPADISANCYAGQNTLELSGEDSRLFVLFVHKIRKRTLDEIMGNVQNNTKDFTYDKAKAFVLSTFQADEDDDIVTTSTVLSVRCPLGLGKIEFPARGRQCRHIQCFDLKTFLMFNKNARSRAWMCTVCHKYIAVKDLIIDLFLKKLLSEVGDDEDLEEVEIMADATWKKRLTDDAKQEHQNKRQKKDQDDISEPKLEVKPFSLLDTSETQVSNTSSSSSNRIGDPIDLTLSSDEEDSSVSNGLPIAQISATSNASQSIPSGVEDWITASASTTTNPPIDSTLPLPPRNMLPEPRSLENRQVNNGSSLANSWMTSLNQDGPNDLLGGTSNSSALGFGSSLDNSNQLCTYGNGSNSAGSFPSNTLFGSSLGGLSDTNSRCSSSFVPLGAFEDIPLTDTELADAMAMLSNKAQYCSPSKVSQPIRSSNPPLLEDLVNEATTAATSLDLPSQSYPPSTSHALTSNTMNANSENDNSRFSDIPSMSSSTTPQMNSNNSNSNPKSTMNSMNISNIPVISLLDSDDDE